MTVYVLMYHFIHGSDSDIFSGIKGLSTETFRSQLNWLQNNLTFVDSDRLIEHVTGHSSIDQDAFHLTFDDGTKDHVQHVLDTLNEKGLSGTFFVSTGPLVDNRVPIVEKQRYLQYSGFEQYDDFLSAFLLEAEPYLPPKYVNPLVPTQQRLSDAEEYLSQFEYYSSRERYYRYIRNEILTNEEFAAAIENLFTKTWPKNETEFVQEFYLTFSDLRQLENAGMTIGGHTHTHPNLSDLNQEKIELEINRSHRLLESELEQEIRVFAYPYGESTQTAVKVLKDTTSIECAFMTGNEPVCGNHGRYQIPRIDSASFDLVRRRIDS